ncbi:MAG: RNA-splicing ligase RtcB [Syntrophus sp. (in: bacteria)]|nr:RNA-splicing ligase RtcB [Syntrophus sp. (in: bacteria)]
MEKERPFLKKIDLNRYGVEKHGTMNVEGLLFLDDELLKVLGTDESITQVENVASLPGIVHASMAMPDIHWGYGFPIGGVAAFDADQGVVSPGGVGYDINCGVRLMRSSLSVKDAGTRIKEIIEGFYLNVPSGIGSRRKDLRLSREELRKVVQKGAQWAIEQGYGTGDDLEYIDDKGQFAHADPDNLSERAYERGREQLGTLGSGNHFVEIGYIAEVFDREIAQAFGLFENQITIMIHTGSRGLGYQVCDDYIREMVKTSAKYGITLPDRQLCCAPVTSPEGRAYLSAMAGAANYAFANRQLITHWVRETMEAVFRKSRGSLGLTLVYDVCHNTAKIEKHRVQGKDMTLCVHRKGATRAFGPGNPSIPEKYKAVGQPVLIPGDMGRASYVLAGTKQAMEETFGSTCHGAGRVMSRSQAKRSSKGRSIQKEMEARNIHVRAASRETLAEEMPEAYKDVSKVVRVVHDAGISRIVAKIIPLGSIKG